MTPTTAVSAIALCGTWLSVVLGTWKLFESIDKAASATAKQSAANWLKSRELSSTLLSAVHLLEHSFDYAFGAKLLSIQTFKRSCVASCSFFTIVLLVWAFIHPDELFQFLLPEDHTHKYLKWIGPLLAIGLYNLLPDYLSLVKSRKLLRWSRTSDLAHAAPIALAADLLGSAAIGLIPTAIMLTAVVFLVGGNVTFDNVTLIASLFIDNIFTLRAVPGYIPLGAAFYTTFFTSIWFIFSAASGVLLRLAEQMSIAKPILVRYLDVENKPHLAIGLIAILVETMAFIPFAIFSLVS